MAQGRSKSPNRARAGTAAGAAVCLAATLAGLAALAQDSAGEEGWAQAEGASGVSRNEDADGDDAHKDDAPRVKEIDISDSAPVAVDACFYPNAARNVDAFDDRHVYLRTGRDDHFLLTLQHGCIGLRNAFQFGIAADSSRVCGNSFASVVYGSFGRQQSCRILQVQAVASEETARALAQRRLD